MGLALWNAINSIVVRGALQPQSSRSSTQHWVLGIWKQDPNMLEILRASANAKFRARYDPGKWAAAPWTLLTSEIAQVNVDNELTDFEAAGSLAEELPWWGWLEDGRSCLTRAGELMSIGRVTPSVLDGQTPEQLDRVIDRWQRMLSGVDSQTRLYFYLLRRPVHFENQADGDGSSVAALGRRKRQAFLEERVQSVSAYVAWAHDPGLSAVTTQKTGGPWWIAYAKNWMARRRNQHESVYLHSSIAEAAGGFGNWSKQAGRWSMT